MLKRSFDLIFSFAGFIILFPVFFIICFIIKITSKGPILFKQTRVGKNSKKFRIFKFRTMYINAEKSGQLTVGMRDSRITPIGYYLRKSKLDELPQLINIILGEMSFVGPRPEVPKYVSKYNNEQTKVLNVRPGITDLASLEYIDENNLLANTDNPEKLYIEHIMPAKLDLNMQYIENQSLLLDLKLIFLTIFKIIGVKIGS